MASDPIVEKSQRKHTTYGKSNQGRSKYFEFPALEDQSEDELQSAATLPHRSPQTFKGKSASSVSSPSARKQPLAKRTYGTEYEGESSSLGMRSKAMSGSPEGAKADPFDVPLSENDDEADASSPFKPALKRRKIPGDGKNGTLTPTRSKAPKQTSEKEEKEDTLKKAPTERSPTIKADRSLLAPPSAKRPASKSTPSKLGMKTMSSSTTNRSPTREAIKRKATEDSDSSRKPYSSAVEPENPERDSQLGQPAGDNVQRTPRPRSGGSLSREARSSLSEPRTPTEGKNSEYQPTQADVAGPQGNAFAFMSPSGLDFHWLDISETSAQTQSTQEAKGHDRRPTSVLRAKLKDRLATRDGASYSDSDGDRMLSPDLEEPSACPDINPPTSSQSASQIGLDKSLSSEPLSSQHVLEPISRVPLGTSPRHTYAARNRTLRRDEDATEDDMFASLAEASEAGRSGARRIRTEIQPRAAHEAARDPLDPDESDLDDAAVLKNIHELREAGASARLRGETEAVLDEVESDNASTRRNGFLDLLLKLQQKGFRDSFSANSLDSRLFNRVKTKMEPISNLLLSMALLQILTGQASSQALVQSSSQESIAFFQSLLGETHSFRSIAKDRKSNATKAFQQGVEQACHSYLQSPIWKFGAPSLISPRVVSLHVLECLARYVRGRDTQATIFPDKTMDLLSAILASSSPLSSEPQDLEFRVTVSILEIATLGGTGRDHSSAHWHSQLLEILAKILGSASNSNLVQNEQTLSLLLRLAINLTNGNAAACMVFSRHDLLHTITLMIQSQFASIANAESNLNVSLLDNLVLSLGFLINLAENTSSARKLFAQATDAWHPPLDVLLHLFTSKWVKAFEVTSEEESRESVPLGYLAVLLAFISSDSENRAYVASKLEGGTLRHLLIAVEAFLSYHRKVAEEVQGVEEGSEFRVEFVGRVQAILDDLKALET